MTSSPTSIPVRILTGSLGAGKTTLINALLNAGHLKGSAIIVNEFGDVGIDHDLIERSSDDVNLLAGGCLCCHVKEDLVDALMRLEKAVRDGVGRAFDRVIIETSGLAEPAPLLHMFAQSPYLQGRFHLEGLITVVDAQLGAIELQKPDSTAMRQAVLADRLLISKAERVNPEHASQLRDELSALNPFAFQMPVHTTHPSPEWLAPIPPSDGRPGRENGLLYKEAMRSWDAVHDDELCCFDLQWTGSQPLPMVGEWLHQIAETYGERLMRVKGIVCCPESFGAYAVHVVQHIVSAPQTVHASPGTNRLVFITRGLEPNDVRPDWQHSTRIAQASRRAPRLFSSGSVDPRI